MTRATPDSKAEQDVRRLADALMLQHGVADWAFSFDNAKERLGSCDHWRKRITISRLLVLHGTPDEVRCTILHEIAHALCDGFEGHGPEWKQKAAEIGARPDGFPGRRIIPSSRAWKGTCPHCGIVRLRHRRYTTYCRPCEELRDGNVYPIRWELIGRPRHGGDGS